MKYYFVQMSIKSGEARFSNKFGKFDEFVCRLEDVGEYVNELMETDESLAEPTMIEFKVIESELSFEEWCKENEVLTDSYDP